MSKKILAVDQDYVLAKLLHKWLATYNKVFKDDLRVEDVTYWDMRKVVKPEAKDYILNMLKIENFYRDLEVVEDSQRVLRELSEKYEIIIVTDPYSKMSLRCKYEWLDEYFAFIPPQNYVFTGNKSVILADYLIDDGVHNLEGFQGYGLLFDAPYNKGDTRFYRVNNWDEIGNTLMNNEEKIIEFYKGRKNIVS